VCCVEVPRGSLQRGQQLVVLPVFAGDRGVGDLELLGQ
jgi:hypothetical protein